MMRHATPRFMSLCFLILALTNPLSAEGTLSRTADGKFVLRLQNQVVTLFGLPRLGSLPGPEISITSQRDGWQRVEMTWTVAEEFRQDELAVEFDLAFGPDFHWMPHLAPETGFVVGQHVFRSPAIIAARGSLTLAIIPDLALVGQRAENPWFLDLDAAAQKAWLGLTLTQIPIHVGFQKQPGMIFRPGPLKLAFYITAYADTEEVTNPWRRVSSFLWEQYARPLYAQGEPSRVPMDIFVKHTYRWAFESWAHAVWQEFELNGSRVGAPQFIVNISQSPNYPGPWFQREFLSIWNQTWFSSLRSASGLSRWAKRMNDDTLLEKARLTKELALAAPMHDGIFPAVIRTDNEIIDVNGRKVYRPKPWSTAYWTNSNRSPRNLGVTSDWYHVLDASWTALLMLRWYDELEQDERLLQYAITYADTLLSLQDPQGFFPGWLHPDSLKPTDVMSQTPETAMSATFLIKLADLTGRTVYRDAAIRAVNALLGEVVPMGRWEDYETYWSCCSFGQNDHVGKKYARNNMYKQNNLSIFWTAEALLETYRATQEARYLKWGRRTIDELSMSQQVWQPPFIYVPALGGFGVMNFDGEWNDSRQSLFAELFMDYYRETGDPHLFERGISALKSAFIMMYCPENPQQLTQWEKAHPFFGPADYGFTMENYGHGGQTNPEGGGIGTFTIYDWGNGAASEARNRIYDHYGDLYVDRPRGAAFGIDSVTVSPSDAGIRVRNLSDRSRTVRVVFEDGSARLLQLDRDQVIRVRWPER